MTYNESLEDLATRMRSCADAIDRYRQTAYADQIDEMEMVITSAGVAATSRLLGEAAQELVVSVGGSLPDEYRWMIEEDRG